jgi:hypothetical protein
MHRGKPSVSKVNNHENSNRKHLRLTLNDPQRYGDRDREKDREREREIKGKEEREGEKEKERERERLSAKGCVERCVGLMRVIRFNILSFFYFERWPNFFYQMIILTDTHYKM